MILEIAFGIIIGVCVLIGINHLMQEYYEIEGNIKWLKDHRKKDFNET